MSPTVDPNQPSNQTNPTGPRRSVDGVRRTSGPVAQPRPMTPTATPTVATATKPAKPSRRQQRKDAKVAKKTTKQAKKASQKQVMPVAQSSVGTMPTKSASGLKVFFQTVLAIVVILAVAMAIVVLYVRYYQ